VSRGVACRPEVSRGKWKVEWKVQWNNSTGVEHCWKRSLTSQPSPRRPAATSQTRR